MIERSVQPSLPEAPLPTVLLVDDEADWILLARAVHRRCQPSVLMVADSAALALALVDELAARGRRLDLLLVDMQMPEMGGLELLSALRQREVPPIGRKLVLSSCIDPGRLREARSCGADGLLDKPLRVETLNREIGRSRLSTPEESSLPFGEPLCLDHTEMLRRGGASF